VIHTFLPRKPVYVVGAERCTWKFTDFHKTLRERGLTRPFTGLEDVRIPSPFSFFMDKIG